jgi:hypothetical protein
MTAFFLSSNMRTNNVSRHDKTILRARMWVLRPKGHTAARVMRYSQQVEPCFTYWGVWVLSSRIPKSNGPILERASGMLSGSTYSTKWSRHFIAPSKSVALSRPEMHSTKLSNNVGHSSGQSNFPIKAIADAWTQTSSRHASQPQKSKPSASYHSCAHFRGCIAQHSW